MKKQAVVGFIPSELYRELVEYCGRTGKSIDDLVSQALLQSLPGMIAPAPSKPKPAPATKGAKGEFQCQLCGKRFGSIHALHGHMASHRKPS